MKLGIAAKSFILNDKKELLLIKRSENDVHKPGAWEVPGGRLSHGEDFAIGLRRETREETGLDIEVISPIKVHSFAREDGEKITMTTFLCRLASANQQVMLSKEHSEYCWLGIESALSRIVGDFHEDILILKKNFMIK